MKKLICLLLILVLLSSCTTKEVVLFTLFSAITLPPNSVLSLYHDQGHIATKTYDFERTISITCGMPILRTSVDHGTAFDIAGSGRASAVSMIEAIAVAAKYAPFWKSL